MKVLCSHDMFTTVWVCKEKRIKVYAGVDVWLDKVIADKYSSTFTALDPQPKLAIFEDEVSEDEKSEVDTEPEPITISEARELPVPEAEEIAITISEARQLPVTDDELDEIETYARLENKEMDHAQALLQNAKLQKSQDEVTADLIEAIDGFESRKELDVYAEKLGVKLDGRKSLKNMKQTLKEKWKLV